MAKRDLDSINIPPLKARRRELRNNPTPGEAILWKHLQRRQMLGKKFRRQYSIGRYIVDFFCVECDIGVELDGAPHFRELRFENRTVHHNIQAVLETIREAIRN